MESVRVFVMGLPGLVGEMLETEIEDQPDLVLVRGSAEAELTPATGLVDPHVVIVGAGGSQLTHGWRRALSAHPGLRVIAVDPEDGTGVLYEMRPHAVALGEVSAADIVGAIRGMAASSGG